MGLFDVFKKKEKVQVSIQTTLSVNTPKVEDEEYINAVILHYLSACNSSGDTKECYPRTITHYNLCLSNPVKKRNELIRNGFLELKETQARLELMKAAEIKDIASEIGVSISKKKKSEIIDLIVSSDADLSKFKIPEAYMLSEKGIEYMSDKLDLVEVWKHYNDYNISIDEYRRIKNKQPYLKYNDIAWQIFQERDIEYYINKNYGLARNVSYNRYVLLLGENKYLDALYHLLTVVYFDLSGLNNSGKADFDSVELIEGIKDRAYKLKDYYSPEIVDRIISGNDIPFNFISQSDFKNIVNDIMDDSFETLEAYSSYKKSKKRKA